MAMFDADKGASNLGLEAMRMSQMLGDTATRGSGQLYGNLGEGTWHKSVSALGMLTSKNGVAM
ncbi:MAG: hypothetical protein EB060_01140 [Proteobacteria bacterium]|nr:hypothetical protein [Pseudomonadota bacterium]